MGKHLTRQQQSTIQTISYRNLLVLWKELQNNVLSSHPSRGVTETEIAGEVLSSSKLKILFSPQNACKTLKTKHTLVRDAITL